jgi:hypothetical protein
VNFGSDHRVRNAFRATLDEKSSASVVGTQEVDAADVLEVTDLANAIARAEEVLRTRSSRAVRSDSSDIFDGLLGNARKAAEPTDDASGPALHAPYLPTPLPPRVAAIPLPPGITRPATLLRAPEGLTPFPGDSGPLPSVMVAPQALTANATQRIAAIPQAPQTAPILILDEDAFYHPAGRIRTLAEATLDGYRPEATVLTRIRERRQTLSWVVLLVLAPFLLIVLFAVAVVVGRAGAGVAEPAAPTAAPAPPTPAAKPVVTAAKAPEPAPPPMVTATPASLQTAPASDPVPVFDVNSLKSAPPVPAKR